MSVGGRGRSREQGHPAPNLSTSTTPHPAPPPGSMGPRLVDGVYGPPRPSVHKDLHTLVHVHIHTLPYAYTHTAHTHAHPICTHRVHIHTTHAPPHAHRHIHTEPSKQLPTKGLFKEDGHFPTSFCVCSAPAARPAAGPSVGGCWMRGSPTGLAVTHHLAGNRDPARSGRGKPSLKPQSWLCQAWKRGPRGSQEATLSPPLT